MRTPTLAFGGVLAAALCLSAPAPVAAEDLTGGVAGEWLSGWNGARSVGMGGANVAWAQDPLGALWNPAGLSRMDQYQVHFETARLFEDTAVHGFSIGSPGRTLPSFGLSILSLSSGEFEKTNDLNESLGTFDEGDVAFLFTVSKSITPRFSVGTNVKVVRQSIDEFDGAGVGADLGLLWTAWRNVRLGLAVQNLGGPGIKLRETEESWPTEYRGGVALPFLGGRGLVSTEIHHVPGPGVRVRSGTEYWVHPVMALRLGYENAPTGGFSYRVAPDTRFDYGMTTHDLGVTHRFGISYRFGGFHASSHARPEIFSPLGERPVTKFELRAHTKADTEQWSLAILDESGGVVRRFGGRGVPPAHVLWDGKDETGLSLPDGQYRYHLAVTDAEGRELVGHERTVVIATSGPRGSVPVLVN
jgi:hypothetical protein